MFVSCVFFLFRVSQENLVYNTNDENRTYRGRSIIHGKLSCWLIMVMNDEWWLFRSPRCETSSVSNGKMGVACFVCLVEASFFSSSELHRVCIFLWGSTSSIVSISLVPRRAFRLATQSATSFQPSSTAASDCSAAAVAPSSRNNDTRPKKEKTSQTTEERKQSSFETEIDFGGSK